MAKEDAVGGTAGKSRDLAGDILERLGWDESKDDWQESVVQRDEDGNLITTGSWACGRYPQDGMRLARVLNGDEDMLADAFQMMLDADENWAEKWRRAVDQQSDNFVEADKQRQRADRLSNDCLKLRERIAELERKQRATRDAIKSIGEHL